MSWLKPLQWIYGIYAFILFLVIMLLILPFVFIASFFGRIRGGNMIMDLCRFWGDCWFPLIFIWVKKSYEAPHDKKRAYIFVTNHISYLDAALLPKAIRQPMRPLAKVELSRVPLFGYIYKNAVVGVDRSSAHNRAQSVRLLKSITLKGISVLVFPEGTFNMTGQPLKDFYDGAFRVAIETETPIKPVLFLDNFDRMHYRSVFSLTPGKCRVVYLDEIPVAGLTLKDAQSLKERVYKIMEVKLRQYNVSWISE
jgi:1-acyl-sn-glycerol-3-phosphate acyltransferase